MAGRELIVDDEYCREIGNYFLKQGELLNKNISLYINILRKIKNNAITKGTTANALAEYIAQAEKLNAQIQQVSETAKREADAFSAQIDEVDQFWF